jgi:hypothetical protein
VPQKLGELVSRYAVHHCMFATTRSDYARCEVGTWGTVSGNSSATLIRASGRASGAISCPSPSGT